MCLPLVPVTGSRPLAIHGRRLLLLFVAFLAASRVAGATPDCHVGSYQLDDGSRVDIAPSDEGFLRWRRFDGTTGALHEGTSGTWTGTAGWTKRPDGVAVRFPDCAGGRIDFNGTPGHRLVFEETAVVFTSHGVRLAGKLILPTGKDRVPVVVLVHGSEHDSALTFYSLQRMLPAEGVGAFVYDKRGTGVSGGSYTQDFDLLADDANAAVREATRLAGPRLGRIGFQAGSQGGWVAPIAANRARVDFVIVCFGLAVTVIDEDQQSVELQMREKGYPPAVIAQAMALARTAEDVFASGFTRGFGEFDAAREKYRQEPWYKDVRGDFAWFLLSHSGAELRGLAPQFQWGTPFHYDPTPTLRASRVPQLWILGGEDYEAPSAETSVRIRSLIAGGAAYTLALYPRAEHGMTLFETTPDGERISTRYAPGYFEMIRDFARSGRLEARYGDAEITRPHSPQPSSPPSVPHP